MADGELERRLRAVELDGKGWGATRIGRELGRSREWVRKWLRRYRDEGIEGLGDRSRRSGTTFAGLAGEVVDEVLEVRRRLESERFGSVGPIAIQADMERRQVTVPSVSSIKRIVAAAGLSRPVHRRRRNDAGVLGLPVVTRPGEWQQADWVQDRMLQGGIRFSSLQIGDVGSHALSVGSHPQRTLVAAVRQLTEKAWPMMSIGLAMSTDNAFSKTTHPDNPMTIWIRSLLMFGVEPIISPPNSLGFTNHAEADNRLWEDRTIGRHHYPNLDALSADTPGFEHWANHDRPVLDPQTHGTRYPAEYVAAHAPTLRWPPAGFSIDDYLDATGANHIPITRGRVTFLRHIQTSHTINIAHHNWPVPTSLPIGVLVVAAINTTTGQLEIRHQGELIHRHRYPIHPATTDPYHPAAQHGLLDHLPTNP